MPGRTLKNHELYMDKLRAYAAACEITIEYRDQDGQGIYIPSRRKVGLDHDLPESTEVATLLHELGHSLDDTLIAESSMGRLDKAYKATYGGKPTKKQLALVVECESRAWVFARSIAKKLRIPLGKWFHAEEKEALKDYRDVREE